MRRRTLALIVLLLAPRAAGAADLGGGLASPMVDPGIFRDDQVRRSSGQFGHWTAVCDEVKALGRRYCSLRSAPVRDERGGDIMIDVSTGDDGRPSALLHLPLGLSLRSGVRITVSPAGTGRAKEASAAPVDVPLALCTAAECQAIWNLDPGRIRALNAGADLRISFCTLRPGFSSFRPSLGGPTCETRVAAAISGSGFKEAVLASVK